MNAKVRSAARREEILAATVELVGERGHQAIRIADVASRLSVSAGLIIYHFHSKEELLAAAFATKAERDLEVARAIVAAEPDSVRGLLGLVAWYLPTGENSHSWRLWLDGWAASQFDSSLAGVVRGFDASWQQLILDVLRGCVAAGVAQIEDPDDAAAQLAAFLNGLALQWLTALDRPSEEQLGRWARRYVAWQCGISDALPAG